MNAQAMSAGATPTRGDGLVLLLPERRRFAGQALAPAFAKAIGRADRLADGAPGDTAQLQRHFDLVPRGWPLAAITRALDCGDAGDDAWLRADPAHVRAEMSGARLMATGELAMAADEAAELLSALQPQFGEAGLPISAGGAGRWYLRLPRGTPLPAFAPPDEALGADVFPFLPAGPEGRRWRALFNDAQVTLHNHPRNATRLARGLPPVNSLWFWGGGVLPAQVRASVGAVVSDDFELRALAASAGAGGEAGGQGSVLLDLRRERDWPRVQARIAGDAIAGLRSRWSRATLDFADGVRYELARGQRWRLWRRAIDPLA